MYPKFSESELLKSKLRTYVTDLPNDEEELENLFIHVAKGNLQSFSDKLRGARIALGYSQAAMSNQLQTRQATFSAWENGANIPRLSTLKRILELYNLDPGELIDVNPLQLINDSSVPILNRQHFLFKSFETFIYELDKTEYSKVVPVPISDQLSFAYSLEDDSMNGGEKAMPKGAIVLCSTKELRNLTTSQKEDVIKNRFALVSPAKQDPQLRFIKYEDGVLSLIPLNPKYKLYEFPDTEDCKKYLSDESACQFKGYETFAASVEVYGIAKRVLFDLE